MSTILELIISVVKLYIFNSSIKFTYIFLLICLAYGDENSALSFGIIKYKIKENQPPGLVVGNLLDNLPFNKIFITGKYHFILQKENEEFFTLKPRSSMLSTSKIIDLESICNNDCINGSKEFHLVAILMQNKQFIQELRFSVLVEDINDNEPYFKQPSYEKSIKEIIYGPGKTIELPRAFDKDISIINNNISYSMEGYSNVFQLNVNKDSQPNLIILRELDAETQDIFKLILLAWNPNYPSRPSVSLIITITIEDMNDNEPKFTQSIYRVPIPENVELHHQIIQLKATDKDKTSKLQYLILPAVNRDITETFAISDQGIISLIKTLDYETNRKYSIPVRVTDGEFSSNSRVEVVIIDVNDCPPQFTLNPENIVIPENTANQTLLGHMNVIDQDSSYVDTGIECREKSHNQVLRFEIIEGSNDRTKKINIYLNQIVDRDLISGDKQFSVIICNDIGVYNKLTSTFTVTLTIVDTNDNAPIFTLSDYVVRVKENLRPKYLLIQVLANDKDFGINSEIKYFISDQNHQQFFKINAQTGQIVGIQSLDREKQDYYQVIVLATDSAINEERRTATATVHIHVIDVNDCVPKINETMTAFSVFENQPIGTIVGNLIASDCDIGQNGKFIFTLIPSAYSHYFELSANGSLFTKISFDRESLNQVKFCLRITVRDVGEELHLSSKTVVCIKILDENDNPPKINIIPDFIAANNYSDNNTTDCSISVSKFEPANSPIFPFTYSDADEGPNSQVILSILVYPSSHKSNQLFYLNITEKSIKMKRIWQSTDAERFLITLIASDKGIPSKETKKLILVQFLDIPSRFLDTSISTASMSNVKINVLIIIVLVTISTVLTTALVGAIVCMLQPCVNKQQNIVNRNGLPRDNANNNNIRIKSYPDSYMVTSSIIDSADNDETEFKGNPNLQRNDYCKSEHHWTHEIDESGRPINYFTLPPQLLACTATTTHEEQRSDSGRGASDEDNPNYISTTDVFQYKPLYSMIPNVAYSSMADGILSMNSPISISAPTNAIITSIPLECLSSTINNELATKNNGDNFSFLCSSSLPFYSISYGQNLSLMSPSMNAVPESDTNIPLLNLDSCNMSTHLPSLSTSSSSNIINNNNINNNINNNSRIENIDDDMVNLSSHIDQLFFTKHPIRFQSFGKS